MALKYKKRAKIWENSTKTNRVDLNELYAISYDWWPYLRRINGLVVFNNGHYSPTTDKHQRDCIRLLERQGINIDLMLHSTANLENLPGVINDCKTNIKMLIKKIRKKGSKRFKNIERMQEIRKLRRQINTLNRLIQ